MLLLLFIFFFFLWRMSRAGSRILRKGGVAPGKDCERLKHEAPGGSGFVLPKKNLKIHVCQKLFPK